MPMSRVQTFIKKLSNSQNVKRVLTDIQNVSEDLQKRMNNLTKEDAVQKYKEIMTKVAQAEKDLKTEVKKIVVQVKKSASKVEDTLKKYRKKAKSAQSASRGGAKKKATFASHPLPQPEILDQIVNSSP